MAPISWLSLSIPKAGNTNAENEDAVFPESGVGKSNNGSAATFLVADGATQTSFSGLWAKSLIETCSKTNLSEAGFYRAVKTAQNDWQKSLTNVELPWHAQEKLRQGAFSALAWLEIQYFPLHPASAFVWNALAVGDCCLFISRNQEIYLSLPLQDHHEFSNTPILIPSKSEKMESIKGKIQTARGSLKMGDQLILASDALSSWILRKTPTERLDFFNLLLTIKKGKVKNSMSFWVSEIRRKNEIKNDDTSFVFIELGETD